MGYPRTKGDAAVLNCLGTGGPWSKPRSRIARLRVAATALRDTVQTMAYVIILVFSKSLHHAFSLFYVYLCMSECRKRVDAEKELQLSRNTIATTTKGKERNVQ